MRHIGTTEWTRVMAVLAIAYGITFPSVSDGATTYVNQALTCNVQVRRSFSNGQEFSETGTILVDVLATKVFTQISLTSSLSSISSTFVTTREGGQLERKIVDESNASRWSVENAVPAENGDGMWTTKIVIDRRSGDLLISQSLMSRAVVAVTAVSGKCEAVPSKNKF